jgi:hypothetical protein
MRVVWRGEPTSLYISLFLSICWRVWRGSMGRRIAIRLNRARDIISKKKRIHIAELMLEVGYSSLEYFKRSFVPLLQHFYGDCLIMEGEYMIWKCEG